MSIEVLDDIIVTGQEFAQNITGRLMRKNQRVTTANGFESINIVQDKTLREYDVNVGPLRRAIREQFDAIFENTEAGAYGFLLLDPKDNSLGTSGRVADLGGGNYQLYKRYTVAGRHKDRKITRPMTGTITVFVSGVATSATVNYATGQMTITGLPSAALVTVTGQFYVPVHFLNDQIEWSMNVAGSDPDGRFYSSTVTLQEVRE
jgi:uncharacterized protein (TIGR02217 family)